MYVVQDKNINSAIDSIIKTTESTVDSEIYKAGFDKTRKGRINSVLGNGNYDVEVDGVIYKNIKTLVGKFNRNDIVNVKFPNNQTTNMYINELGIEDGVVSTVYVRDVMSSYYFMTIVYSNGFMKCIMFYNGVTYNATFPQDSGTYGGLTGWYWSGGIPPTINFNWYFPEELGENFSFIRRPNVKVSVFTNSGTNKVFHTSQTSATKENKFQDMMIMIYSDEQGATQQGNLQVNAIAEGWWK